MWLEQSEPEGEREEVRAGRTWAFSLSEVGTLGRLWVEEGRDLA